MIAPVIALVLLTHLMLIWMYATRLPAIAQLRMKIDPFGIRGAQMSQLPARVRWKTDNYNHLLEQPTLFYAVALSLAVFNDHSPASLVLAWAYTLLRVVHSLVQVTVNSIPVRFSLFVVSSFVLFALTCRAAVLVF